MSGSRVILMAFAALVTAGPLAAQAPTSVVRGRVTEAGGIPMDAAQVSIQGTTRGARTNAQGVYRILGVPAGAQQVRVQLIGFAAQTRTVTLRGGDSVVVDFELRPAAVSLDALVVTGTAVESRKKEVGNSTATISVRDLEAAPDKDTQDVLCARAPGT